MPGTTQEMRDYIVDNYLHTILGLDPSIGVDGYPMDAVSLYNTAVDYVNANCSSIKSNIVYDYGSIFYTHANPKKIIDSNHPV